MLVHRGFLMVKNASGGLVPFFVKVRESDIVNASGNTKNDEVIGEISKWKYVTHTLATDRRIKLSRRFSLDSLSLIDSDICHTTVTLPHKLFINDTTITINKESSNSKIFGPSSIEASLINPDSSGYSNQLNIKFFSNASKFTASNIILDTIIVSVNIDGYL